MKEAREDSAEECAARLAEEAGLPLSAPLGSVILKDADRDVAWRFVGEMGGHLSPRAKRTNTMSVEQALHPSAHEAFIPLPLPHHSAPLPPCHPKLCMRQPSQRPVHHAALSSPFLRRLPPCAERCHEPATHQPDQRPPQGTLGMVPLKHCVPPRSPCSSLPTQPMVRPKDPGQRMGFHRVDRRRRCLP